MKRHIKSILLIFIIIMLNIACGNNNKTDKNPPQTFIPELIIYCENGVVTPIYEISLLFEKKYRCKVTIHNGTVRNLISMIDMSGSADLFIPDFNYGFSLLKQKQPKLINDSLYLGTNKLVFVVPKGNPEGFDGNIESLRQNKYAIIIANPETSLLGYKTKQALEQKNIYTQVVNNITTLSADSRGLIQSISDGNATIGIDWVSSYFYNSNEKKVDTIYFTNQITEADIYASVLSTSKNPGLAQTFLAVLSSPLAVKILKDYGIEKKKKGLTQ